MSSGAKIIVMDRLQTGESANPAPENILAGIPRTRVSNQYGEETQQFFCGMWSSTGGKWRVRYTEHEFCVLIEGRVRIESQSGERHDLRAGDAFVVPAGFEGIWEVVDPCKKWYAVFEAAAPRARSVP
ncbi:MAG: cupin domain-containing protein [Steroidobacteraceae bacterium]